MRKSIVLSTRTDIIVVAKLAQFYEEQRTNKLIYTKSALIDACLADYLWILKNNGMIDKEEVLIHNESEAYRYLVSVGYNVTDKNVNIPKDILKNIQAESTEEVNIDIETIRKAIEKTDKDL